MSEKNSTFVKKDSKLKKIFKKIFLIFDKKQRHLFKYQ